MTLTEIFLIAWVGTSTNFQILEQHFAMRNCEESIKVWEKKIDNSIKLECVVNFKEGRSRYPRPNAGIEGVAK